MKKEIDRKRNRRHKVTLLSLIYPTLKCVSSTWDGHDSNDDNSASPTRHCCGLQNNSSRLHDLDDLHREDALSSTGGALLRMGVNPLRRACVWHAVEEPSSFPVTKSIQTHTQVLRAKLEASLYSLLSTLLYSTGNASQPAS